MRFLISLLLLAGTGWSQDLQDGPWIWNDVGRLGIWDLTTSSTPTASTKPTTNTGSTESSTTSTTEGTPKICPQCPFSREYNPVCGTDRITYDNIGMLRCAKLCGVDVDVLFYSRCRPISFSN